MTSDLVLEILSDVFVLRGIPGHIRSDNGTEFAASRGLEWLARIGTKTLFIEPDRLWEDGFTESFNGKLRDELLNREIFDMLLTARVVTE